MEKESRPLQYSEEEYYPEVSTEGIEHNEKINQERKGVEDTRIALLREKALQTLKFDRVLAEKSANLGIGEKFDQLCDEYIKMIGREDIERILNDGNLKIEVKNNILNNLNNSLNKGIGLRFFTSYGITEEKLITDFEKEKAKLTPE